MTSPSQARTYVREVDGAKMVKIAPHQFVSEALSIAIKRRAGEA